MNAWLVLALLGPAPGPVAPGSETPPASAPVVRSGSVVISIVGNADPAAVRAAVDGRLASQGLVSLVEVADGFDNAPRTEPEDRLLEVWITIPERGPMRIVMADPTHQHTLVRTIPIEAGPTAVSFEEAAIIVEEALAMVSTGDPWPATEPAAVRVEPPVPTPAVAPAPPVMVAEPPAAPPSGGRFGRGLFLGGSVGVAAVSDEFGRTRLGIPTGFGVGYLFGRMRDLPDLRISVGGALESTRVFHPDYDSYSQQAFYAESRIGKTRGPVWGYGAVGLGSGFITRRRDRDRATVSAGVLGKLGAGLGVRLNRRIALHFEGEASGNISRIGMLAFRVGFTTYWARESRS